MARLKLTRGRQKIQMKKITDKNSLNVTFSKRHTGIFKKASEVCTLCGVDIAIIIFSPNENAFSFGHPDVEEIVERFMAPNPPPTTNTSRLIQHFRNRRIQELNDELTHLLARLDAEKKIGEEHNKRSESQEKLLWDAPIKNLGVKELEKLKVVMLELKKNCEKEAADKLMAEVANPRSAIVPVYTGLGGMGHWI